MKKSILIALGTALFLVTPRLRAASDYLLEIDGIKGESSDEAYPGNIDIDSFSWGVTNAGGAGKATFKEFTLSMRLSKASPQLLVACATGVHIKKATLHVRKAGGGQQEYYKLTLSDCIVTSYSQSGNTGTTTGDSRPMESLSLNFAKVSVSYTADDGSVTDGEVDLTPIQ